MLMVMLISYIELMIAAAYGSSKRKKQVRIIVIALLSFGMALLGLCLMLYVLKKKPKREGNTCKKIPKPGLISEKLYYKEG